MVELDAFAARLIDSITVSMLDICELQTQGDEQFDRAIHELTVTARYLDRLSDQLQQG